MPFTPFHFGPAATLAFLFPRRLDLFVFVTANIIIDIQPLIVILFFPAARPHGWTHTFLFAGFLGGVFGELFFFGARRLRYSWLSFPAGMGISRGRALVSGVLGAWFHVLLDAPLYGDIRPFFPSAANSLYGLVPMPLMYQFCMVGYGVAIAVYFLKRRTFSKRSFHE